MQIPLALTSALPVHWRGCGQSHSGIYYFTQLKKKKDSHYIPKLSLRKRNTQCWEHVSSIGAEAPRKRYLDFTASMAQSRDLGVGLVWLANEVDNRGPQSLGYSAFVLHQNKETKYLWI